MNRAGIYEYRSPEPDSCSCIGKALQVEADSHEQRLHEKARKGTNERVGMRVADHLHRRELVLDREESCNRVVVDYRLAHSPDEDDDVDDCDFLDVDVYVPADEREKVGDSAERDHKYGSDNALISDNDYCIRLALGIPIAEIRTHIDIPLYNKQPSL